MGYPVCFRIERAVDLIGLTHISGMGPSGNQPGSRCAKNWTVQLGYSLEMVGRLPIIIMMYVRSRSRASMPFGRLVGLTKQSAVLMVHLETKVSKPTRTVRNTRNNLGRPRILCRMAHDMYALIRIVFVVD